LDFQGAWGVGGPNAVLERLSRKQQHGSTYAEIAEELNKKIERYLLGYLDYRKEVDSVHPEYKVKHDKDIFYSVFWLDMKSNNAMMSHAKFLLESLRYKEEQITEILKSGLNGLKSGKTIFSKDYPISKKDIIEKLKTWRKGKLHQAIKKQEEIERQEWLKQRENRG
jgi:hypothetical protein